MNDSLFNIKSGRGGQYPAISNMKFQFNIRHWFLLTLFVPAIAIMVRAVIMTWFVDGPAMWWDATVAFLPLFLAIVFAQERK